METIHEDTYLKISVRQATSGNESGAVLLSFTGIGHGMGGINVQKPEFFGAGRSFDNTIFISDKTRSWANSLDFDLIARCIAPYVGNRHLHAIGNSMGGFNSIIASHFLPIAKVIAFAPQFSVNPLVVPWEKRWKKYVSNITDFRFDTVEPCMNDRTTYYIFSGGEGDDYRHACLFPVRHNVHHYSFKGIFHDVGKELKEKGALTGVIHACLGDNRLPDIDAEYEVLSPPPQPPKA